MKQIEGNIIDFSVHEYCCRIVQRMYEHCHNSFLDEISQIIVRNFYYLSKNEFGIFVLSSMLINAEDRFKSQILQTVSGSAASMSLQKDGSKLIENIVKMMALINSKHVQ